MKCLGVCLLVATTTCFAQYRFDHWTAETGLPQNIITAIQQTPEGYLWIATLDGLTRFDGVRFRVFNKSNTPGISSNRFTCFYQDAQGDLWAGTEIGVVTRYHQGQFITYSTAHGLPKNHVYGLSGNAQGQLWVLSGNKAHEWDATAERFNERKTLLFPGNFGRLGWEAEGGLWRQDQAGLHWFAKGAWAQVALPAEVGGNIKQVAQTGDGTIWVLAANERIVRLKAGQVTVFPPSNRQSRSGPRPMMEWRDRAGKSWELEIGPNLSRKLTITSSGQPESIRFSTLYEDRDGNLWLGTDGQGLYRIRKQIVTTYSQEQGLINRNIYVVYEDRAGAIWVGAWDGGLSQIKDGKIKNFTTKEGLSAGAVSSLSEDAAGRLWIATSTGLQIYEQGHFTSISLPASPKPTGFPVLYHDRQGALWISAEAGLYRYHNGQAQYPALQEGIVRTIIEAAAGGVWIGGYGGLNRWEEGKITSWTEQEGLPGNAVRALYEDRDGVLWIGTIDSGLGRFKDGKFTRYTTREGLFNDGVFQILEDAYGNLWMSCNRGIYRVRKQELNEFAAGARREINSIAFGKSDGMLNVECNGGLWPAGTRSRDGRLWFPTQDGVVVIDPAAVTTNQPPPPVLIEAVWLDRTPISFQDEVRLSPGQGNLEIQYTALSFTNAVYTRFKYKIEGLTDDWIEAGTQRTAFFSYLPPGNYTFKVIAANSDGVWNTEGKSLRLVVVPPLYRRWWFILTAALLVVGGLTVAVQYRLRQLERAQLMQQQFSQQLIASQEAERKRIAAELHDGLSQSLVIIKNRAALSLDTPQDTENALEQLEEIAEASTQALEEVRSVIHDLRPIQLDRLGFTKALQAMLQQVGAAHQLRIYADLDETDGVFSKEAEINLYRIVQEGLNNVVKHAQANEARVLLKKQPAAVWLTITDNGRGFLVADLGRRNAEIAPPPKLNSQNLKSGGFGLTGMVERARILGCRPLIQSVPGQGTTITLKIPTATNI
jgi:signal transduction histidine kinase/ligand-binding sensor domain-containing protein